MSLSWKNVDLATTLKVRVYEACGLEERMADFILNAVTTGLTTFESKATILKALAELFQEPNQYAYACYLVGCITERAKIEFELEEGSNEFLKKITQL
jgi:hypothetical protein